MKNEIYDSQQELQKYKELVAFVSHEIRNMVHGIYALSSALNTNWEDLSNNDKKDITLKIRHISQKTVDLSSQILDFSKFNFFTDLNLTQCSVADLIYDIAEEAKICHPEKENDVSLQIQLDKSVDTVFWDFSLMQQAFRNLLNNAYKFTDHGSISIYGKTQNDTLILTICDTGRGFGKSNPDSLFDQYIRGKNVHDKLGTGLGLAITRAIIQAHNGTIAAKHNTEQQGAQFIVTLPRSKKEHSVENKKNIPLHNLKKHFNCLLIDDETINIKSFEFLVMQEKNISLNTIQADESLILKIKNITKEYDIIFLDLMMPHNNTHEVMHAIKDNNILSTSKIIIQTGLSEGAELDEALKNGAVEKLIKPFNLKDIIKAINNIMN